MSNPIIGRIRRGGLLGLALILSLLIAGVGVSAQGANPIIYNLKPDQNAAVNGPAVEVGASIRGSSVITAWQVQIDNQVVTNFPSPTSAEGGLVLLVYGTLNFGPGQHSIYVSGTDSYGHAGGYRWNFTVQGNGPPPPGKLPSFTNLTPAPGATTGGSVIRIAITVNSTANLYNESLTLDGRLYAISGRNGGTSETIYADISGVAPGQHTVVAQASDTAGNTNSQAWSFTVPGCTGGNLYFPQTGRCVNPTFYQFWQQHGGLPTFGYPISDQINELSATDGKTYAVQYFERARFELHPENAPPYNVLLGLLGNQFHHPEPPVAPIAGRLFFAETGHNVASDFIAFWLNNGGLPIFGYPISEEFNEVNPLDGKSYTVQYFERARFERHPENQPPYNVLLGQLGKQLYQQKYPQP